MRGQRHAPAALYRRERTGTHWTGGWVSPRAGLDRCGKSRPPPGFDPRTVQPVASRYTDCATLPTVYNVLHINCRLQTVKSIINTNSSVYLKLFSVIFINSCLQPTKQLNKQTNNLTTRSRILFSESNSFSDIRESPSFYGNQSFITAYATARHLSLS